MKSEVINKMHLTVTMSYYELLKIKNIVDTAYQHYDKLDYEMLELTEEELSEFVDEISSIFRDFYKTTIGQKR